MSKFLEADINFQPDKITYVGDPYEGTGSEVAGEDQEMTIMHEWETFLMRRHADFVCERGGHILEIGFGMGISAQLIQDHNPASHTIIELHPQIAEKAREWAADKENVEILEGDWIEILAGLTEGSIQVTPKKFDGVFFDSYGFWAQENKVADMIEQHVKPTTRISHWNPLGFPGSICGFMNHPKYTIDFEKIPIDVDSQPPEYNLSDTYHFPKVFLNE